PTVVENRALYYYKEAKEKLGIDGKPVLLGPITFVALAKGYDKEGFEQTVEKFIPLYTQILQELKEAGATWVQIDEPIFYTNVTEETVALADKVYGTFAEEDHELNIMFETYLEKIFHYEKLNQLPVKAIGLYFVHGDSISLLKRHGIPKDNALAGGIVDGRNVRRADLKEKWTDLETITQYVHAEQLIIQPS